MLFRPRVALVQTRGCMAETRRLLQLGRVVSTTYKNREWFVRVRLDDGTTDEAPLRYFAGYRDEFSPTIEYHWS